MHRLHSRSNAGHPSLPLPILLVTGALLLAACATQRSEVVPLDRGEAPPARGVPPPSHLSPQPTMDANGTPTLTPDGTPVVPAGR